MHVLLTITIPIIMGIITLFIKQRRLVNTLAIITTAVTTIVVITLYPYLKDFGVLTIEYKQILAPFGISFRVDWLSFILLAITTLIWTLTTIYSVDYLQHAKNQARYQGFSLITLGAVVGTLLAGDLLSLFLFFEFMSLSSYVLVIHEGHPQAMKAGFLYLIMTLGGGLALFFGIIMVYQLTGSLTFVNEGFLTSESTNALLAFIGFILGFGMKAGMFPLHIWLPEAHPVAPSPASALLSGIMLKIGAYGLIRVMYNIYDVNMLVSTGWNNILMVLAGITLILGSVFAIAQKDLKRRLAYSSVAQMGYILLGIALVSEQALIGCMFHIFAHAIMKSCLFLAAGAMIMQTGKRNVSDFSGIGKKMPKTMIAFTMAALSMIGIPPFAGFLSKWLLGLGALDVGNSIYAVLLLISSLLNAIYYMPIVISAFFGNVSDDLRNVVKAPKLMLVPIVVLALFTIIFDLIPRNLPLEISRITANFLIGGGPGL